MDGFAALADPNRRRILELLGGGEQAAGAITARFEVSAPAISQHLRVLREAGLVRVRAEGARRIYSLEPAGLAEIERWLDGVQSFWTVRLDGLERELSRSDATSPGGGTDE